METNLNPWETHDWFDRPLEIDPGERITQFICRKCGRAFANDADGRRYAIHASAFAIYRLSDEVSDRWLSELCPSGLNQADLHDKSTRHMNGSSASEFVAKAR